MREKVLPELDDDFASEASEFDTLDELRADIREKVSEALDERTEQDFRVAADRRRRRRGHVDARGPRRPRAPTNVGAGRTPARRPRDGPEAYLQMQGKTREEMIEESKPDASVSCRREAVLRRSPRPRGSRSPRRSCSRPSPQRRARADEPEKLLERLRETGRDATVREDLQARRRST